MLSYISNRLTLRTKMILICIVSIVLVAMGSWLCNRYVINEYSVLLDEFVNDSLSRQSAQIDDALFYIHNVSSFIMSSNQMQDSLNQIIQPATTSVERLAFLEEIDRTITAYYSPAYHMVSITVLCDNLSIAVGKSKYIETNEYLQKLKSIAREQAGRMYWTLSDPQNGEGVICVREIREIEDLRLETLGYLMIRLDINSLVELAISDGTYSNISDMIITDDKQNIIYDNFSAAEDFDFSTLVANPDKIVDINGNLYFKANIKSDVANWEYVLLAPYTDVYRSILSSNTINIVVLLSIILLSAALAITLTNKIFIHFNKLMSKMNQLRYGEFKPEPDRVYQDRHDEIAILHKTFDSMSIELNQLVQDNYVKQLYIKDTQLKLLEQQINPHFLFNTLESIHMMSRFGQTENVNGMIEALGRLLSSTMDKNCDSSTLERELTLVNDYVCIQKIRFGDRLIYKTNIDSRALSKLIPKMSIQPLVENAIIHSLEKMFEPCTITVSVIYEESETKVIVENDGLALQESQLYKFESGEQPAERHGIGLNNINNRIKLMFGEAYHLTLQNLDHKVMVSFSVPNKPIDRKEIPIV